MRRWQFAAAGLAALPLSIGLYSAEPGDGESFTRPVFTVTTTESFNSGSIVAYTGNHEDVYDFIDSNLDRHLEYIRRWVRQPSISAQNVGMQEMATLVVDDLRELGFQEAEIVPTDCHPGVWGYYDSGADKTLALYMMYDVQPVNEELWQVDPFAATLVDTEHGSVLMARGARNQKGPQRAFLNAVDAILAVHDTLPVNLMITVDGEEEIGSVHFSQVIDKYADRLKDSFGVLYPWTSQNAEGMIQIILGSKGLLYFELQATGNEVQGGPQNQAIHSSSRALVDSPVNHLVQALATLTSVDGNTILVEDYYDGLLPPTPDEQRLLNGMVDRWPEEELKKSLAVDHWIDAQTGMTALLDYLYMPTMNVNGIWGGYTGAGSKTILPHQATAKIDSRLPPGLRPERALALIRAHLDKHGFEDIEIHQLSGYPAASTPVTAPIIQAGLQVLNKYADPPLVMPRSGGSAPFDQFTDRLELPVALIGLGFGDQIHAPNEFFVITPPPGSAVAGLAEIEKAYVDLLYAISEQ